MLRTPSGSESEVGMMTSAHQKVVRDNFIYRMESSIMHAEILILG